MFSWGKINAKLTNIFQMDSSACERLEILFAMLIVMCLEILKRSMKLV